MGTGDRIFGLFAIVLAGIYIYTATQIQVSFLSDPVGSKTFPIIIGVVAILCGLVMVLRPDDDGDWPEMGVLAKLAVAVLALLLYAYALKPWGFVGPTFVVAGLLSYQISPRPVAALLTGAGLAIGLYVLFHYALGLTNVKFGPESWGILTWT